MLQKIQRRLSSKSVMSTEDDRSSWGPVLISIGPQCCGKTTFVNSLGENVTEFVLEDSAGIVEKAPVNIAINLWTKEFSTEEELPELSEEDNTLMATKFYGTSLEDRLNQMNNSEQMLLTLLFSEEITLDYFKSRVETLIQDEDQRDLFIDVATDLFEKGLKVTTPAVEVVIVEALNDVKARVAAEVEMTMRLNSNLICWGNTNLSPDFYKETLSFAAKNSRVVRFIRWGQEIPAVSLKELAERNVKRFLSTGRYASISKLALFHLHAEKQRTSARNGKFSHFDLARAAGYDMDLMGRVTLVTEESEKKNKMSRRSSTGSASPLTPKIHETKWTKWTNEGVVFALAPVATPVSPSGEKGDAEDDLGDTLVTDQNSIYRSLDGTDENRRRKVPYNGETPETAAGVTATPTRAKDENPFFCFTECF